MTNTEAITKLTNIMHDDHYSWSPTVLAAFGMAVDALKGAGGDWISRKEAIDALDEQIEQCDKALSSFDISMRDEFAIKVERASLVAFRETLEYLPSAQPDIIRCRNCKFASGDSRICMQFGHSPIGELDFCAWAKRRTDG